MISYPVKINANSSKLVIPVNPWIIEQIGRLGRAPILNSISHFQVAEEIWICENGTVTKWEGGILKYKDHLKSNILKENAATAAAKVRK